MRPNEQETTAPRTVPVIAPRPIPRSPRARSTWPAVCIQRFLEVQKFRAYRLGCVDVSDHAMQRLGHVLASDHLPPTETRTQDFEGRDLMRTRPGSTTEKCPAQSSRLPMMLAMAGPTSAGEGIGIRNRTMPAVAGNPERQASSPKSLSKVRRTRFSRMACANTSESELPGASVRIQARSCPATRTALTASPGKFSFARKRTVSRRQRA